MNQTHRQQRYRRIPQAFGRIAAVGIAALAVSLLAMGPVHMLQAAGLTQSGGAIAGLASFVDQLTDSVKWVAVTVIGLAIAIVGVLFMVGHTRAHDIAIKAAIGAAIIVGLGGIIK